MPDTPINKEKEVLLTQVVINSLSSWHFNPQTINDEFSEKAFHLYIKKLDPQKQFFLESDIEDFDDYIHDIDNQIREGDNRLFELTYARLQQRIKNVQAFYPSLLKKPFRFKQSDTINLP